jgi:plasmid stabilization system protein ParE
MRIAWRPGARQDRRIRQLAYFPDAGRPGNGAFRELVISKTPYVALYLRHADEIEIVHVFHGARNR